MAIKVNLYAPASSCNNSAGTAISNIPENDSFQDVLVLNQSALKAMTIDAMVAESTTGSVSPDAVNAAAILKFRSTLGNNIQAPVPEADWDGGAPKTYTKTPDAAPNTTPSTENAPSTDSLSVSIADVYNSGVLECSNELNSYFKEAADTYGIDVKLLKSIAYAESDFNPNCTSNAGAKGIMQLMPKTAASLGVTDAYDARQNILAGAKYLSIQLDRYDGNITLALAAYNAGPGNVKKYNGVPPFEETQNYVKKVLNCYHS